MAARAHDGPGPTLLDEARGRFVRLLDRPSARRREEVARWRAQDPAHDAAFLEVEADWIAADAGARAVAGRGGDREAIAGWLAAIEARRAARRRARRRAGVALALLCALPLAGLLALEGPDLVQDLAASQVSPRGERREVRLADGSAVLLDADSALDERFAPGERRVRLLRGRAHFAVVPAAEPFVVEIAGGEVRVLGTSFDVAALEEGASVVLEHGRVRVAAPGGGATALVPGQAVVFGAAGIGPAVPVDPADAFGWREGRHAFYGARLGDVVAEIGRYHDDRLVIASSALAGRRVTGSFSLDDPAAALAALQSGVGFRITRLPGGLVLIRP